MTGVTVIPAVPLSLLKAVPPPVAVMMLYWPATPVLWSHARKVIASLTVPFKSPKGSRRILSFGPSSRASSLVVLLIWLASMVSQLAPPSRLYCQVPKLVFNAVIAMASIAAPGVSGSVIDPPTTKAPT